MQTNILKLKKEKKKRPNNHNDKTTTSIVRIQIFFTIGSKATTSCYQSIYLKSREKKKKRNIDTELSCTLNISIQYENMIYDCIKKKKKKAYEV